MKRLPKTFGCPVEFSLQMLGGKWKPVIMARLKERPMRYGELRRLIPALSDKVLTVRLHDLEAQGMVLKQKAAGGTVYRLTPLGETLRPVLEALYQWGETAAPSLDVRFLSEEER